jgi:hypothetical protein
LPTNLSAPETAQELHISVHSVKTHMRRLYAKFDVHERTEAIKKAIPVLRENRVVPRRVVDANADKPVEQKVELQPLHQLPLRADRIERWQQHRPQQLLRRDRRSPDRRVQRAKPARQRRQSLVHDCPDRP